MAQPSQSQFQSSNIKNILKNGLDFLEKEQSKKGSFPSFTTSDPNNFSQAVVCPSIFSTAIISTCLNHVKNNYKAGKITQKTINFLNSQKSENWSFNYWDRESLEFKNMPYPDDLDDTACAMTAIWLYNPKLIPGSGYASFAMLLTALESNVGGPYKTWLVSKDSPISWKDIDLAVNANIGYFLSLQNIKLKNLELYFEDAIIKKQYSSPYYTSAYPIIYFISRFYRGKNKQKIIEYLLENKGEKFWDNPLNTALATISLLNLGYRKVDNEIEYLCNYIEKSDYSAFPFYTGIDPHGDKKRYFAGSKALTLAFCLDAISRFYNSCPKKTQKEDNTIKNEVIAEANETIKNFLKNRENKLFIKKFISSKNFDEIVLFPETFVNSLEKGVKISDQFCKKTCIANYFGWIAYTIYDDLIDEEGNLALLPLANVCMRESYQILSSLTNSEDFSKYIKKAFLEIDEANLWELENTRIKIENNSIISVKRMPDKEKYFNIISNRSFGHGLGLLAALVNLGRTTSSKDFKNLSEAIRHYLTARQLLDDAHDWLSDLKKGQINIVAVYILEKMIEKRKNDLIDLKKDSIILQKLFWFEIADFIFELILSEIEEGLKKLDGIKVLTKNNKAGSVDKNQIEFREFFQDLKNAVSESIEEKKETLDFLQTITK